MTRGGERSDWSAREMRISRRCVSPTSVQAVTSLVDARGDVAAAGSDRAQA